MSDLLSKKLLDLGVRAAEYCSERRHRESLLPVAQWLRDEQVDERSGGIGSVALRLHSGFRRAVERFARRTEEDRYYDMGRDDALRIVLPAALIFHRDFDGADLGLNWAWEVRNAEGPEFEGRSWAWAMLGSQPVALERSAEIVAAAVGFLESVEPSAENPVKADDAVGSASESSGFTPTRADLEIIQALDEAPSTQIQHEVADRSGHSIASVKKRLRLLEREGMVSRPHGLRKGYALTEEGQNRL